MPVPVGLVRANINGLTAGGEQIVHTIHVRTDPNAAPGPPDRSELQRVAANVAGAWVAFLDSPGEQAAPAVRVMLSQRTQYLSVDTYYLGPDGRASASGSFSWPAPQTGQSGGALPPQVAVAASFYSNVPGPTGRGRMFLGGFTPVINDDQGRVTRAATNTLATGMQTFLRALGGGGPEGGDEPVIFSRRNQSVAAIVEVRVGDVFDTMRSRRTSLVESKVRRALA